MKYSLLIILSLQSLILSAQNPELDQSRYEAAAEWLDSKLNYIYFDSEDQRWWKNTFYVNENKEVTIKHISSDRPNTANISDKNYTIRTFKIQDIDPNSLKVSNVKKSRGRIVKGKMLELRTFGYQNLISKTINNRKASSTSYLFLSFPTAVTDSISDYAEVVRDKFKEAIAASTQIYPSDYEHDVERVLKILTGEFQSDGGKTWKTRLIQPHVLELDRGNGDTEFFGYDTNDHRFYLLTLSSQGIDIQHFKLAEKDKLILSDEQGNDSFLIGNLNIIKIQGEEYFRQ